MVFRESRPRPGFPPKCRRKKSWATPTTRLILRTDLKIRGGRRRKFTRNCARFSLLVNPQSIEPRRYQNFFFGPKFLFWAKISFWRGERMGHSNHSKQATMEGTSNFRGRCMGVVAE